MGKQPDLAVELFDQPDRQTMSFRDMAAALEADHVRRIVRLVFLVDERDPAREYHRWHVDRNGELTSLQLQPWSLEEPRYIGRMMRAATRISAEVEKAFTGLILSSNWSRWLLHRVDGIKIERPTYIEEKGTLECVIEVDIHANYDAVYRSVMRVLEQQPGYESRGGTSFAFTKQQEAAIERMPREDLILALPPFAKRASPPLADSPPGEPWKLAADVLRRIMERRRESNERESVDVG
jgi:hypothetical protein